MRPALVRMASSLGRKCLDNESMLESKEPFDFELSSIEESDSEDDMDLDRTICTFCGIPCLPNQCIFEKYLFVLICHEQTVGVLADEIWFHAKIVWALRGFPKRQKGGSFTFLCMERCEETVKFAKDFNGFLAEDSEAINTYVLALSKMTDVVTKGSFPDGLGEDFAYLKIVDV